MFQHNAVSWVVEGNSFKKGKFENKVVLCNIVELINKKLLMCKSIFVNRNIKIDTKFSDSECKINSIPIFLSSIIGNLISNIAFHASPDTTASIELYKKQKECE